jgi:hypothetical protein
MDYNRNYIIFDVSEIDKINFDEIIEFSIDTLRYSLDKTKTFVKWYGVDPLFINELTTKSQRYNLEEINNILIGPEWSPTYE